MKIIFIAVCFLFGASACYADSTVEGISVEAFHVAVSGGKAEPSAGSVQGVSILRDRFDVLEKSSGIPLLKGHGLAVTFTLSGKYQNLESVRLVAKYPEMKAPGGEVYSGIDRTQKSILSDDIRTVVFSYAFDEAWELVEGPWTVEIFDGKTKLGEAQLIAYHPQEKPPISAALPERLASLCEADSVSPDDLAYLSTQISDGNIAECLSRALLFKHAPTENLAGFRSYFAIDRSMAPVVLSGDTINQQVNAVIHEYKARDPAEQMARVYLYFRGKGQIWKKPDGIEINLEFMFRTSVFAAVKAGSKEEALRYAAVADKKSE